MSDNKRPPPDSRGNLQGRMLAWRMLAQKLAQADVREGVPKEKALARRSAEVLPELQKLRHRLQALEEKGEPEEKGGEGEPEEKGGEGELEDFLSRMARLNEL